MTELQIKYNELLLKYDTLVNEHKNLQNDYSENIIIQSMNDMKDIYNIQKKKTDKLNEVIDNIIDMNKSIRIMLSTLYKNTNNADNFQGRYSLKYRIEFIQEILENTLKLKNMVYY